VFQFPILRQDGHLCPIGLAHRSHIVGTPRARFSSRLELRETSRSKISTHLHTIRGSRQIPIDERHRLPWLVVFPSLLPRLCTPHFEYTISFRAPPLRSVPLDFTTEPPTSTRLVSLTPRRDANAHSDSLCLQVDTLRYTRFEHL
jgi:hypothetical protein